METSISLPDKLFYLVEKYAEKNRLSSSELYIAAISSYINKMEKEENDKIVKQINSVCEQVDTSVNSQIRKASKKLILDSVW